MGGALGDGALITHLVSTAAEARKQLNAAALVRLRERMRGRVRRDLARRVFASWATMAAVCRAEGSAAAEREAAEAAGDEIFAHQSEHVSFQLHTPTFTVRLNYGKLHQLAVRDTSDRFDVPDHVTHQMTLGLSRVILGKCPAGMLGDTAAVRTNIYGAPIMTGLGAISGNEEDYKVEGALDGSFKQASH